jgi:uncharacterized protein involved in exopolysaccharide biosynthesis
VSTDTHNDDDSGKKKKRSADDFPIQEYRLVPADQYGGGFGNEDDEIDLIELAKTIWDNRKTIYKFVAVGAVLGLLVALLSPKEYVSSATLMPEYATESSTGGASRLLQQYGGLIGLSGGTYNSSSNAIRVDLYPQIVSSLSFQDKLARQEFYFADYDTMASVYDYYLEINSPGFFGAIAKYTIGLPGVIIKALKGEEDIRSSNFNIGDEIVRLSKKEMGVIKNLRERVNASLDEESGIISVSVKMRDPELAAKMTKYAIEELTLYLTDYRTEKVLIDLDFVETQLASAKERFEEAQLNLADFDDSNQGNLTARARTERQRLQSEYDIAVNVYNTLTQQYEEAKLKVQEETPVFKVLQPVQVPVNDETSGSMVLFVFVLLSGIASLGWIFLSKLIMSVNQK